MNAREMIEAECGQKYRDANYENLDEYLPAAERVIARLLARVEELEAQVADSQHDTAMFCGENERLKKRVAGLLLRDEWSPRREYTARLDKYVANGYTVDEAVGFINAVDKEAVRDATERNLGKVR